MSQQKPTIGFIGLGVMGGAMAANILNAGFPLKVFNRSRPAIDVLVSAGAEAADDPADLAASSEILVLCLPDTPDVETVLFGENGVAAGIRSGSLVIDTSSISPAAAQHFAKRLRNFGVDFVDSPVSGGPKAAKDGTLSCMIGGSDGAIARAMPVLQAIGKTHVHLGPAGAGQLVKACNQLVIASTLGGVSEAIALCRKAGIDPYSMREALLAGSARSAVLEMHAKRLLDGALNPGFRSTLMLKDLSLALDAGRSLGVFMPATALAAQLMTAAVNTGRENKDSAAVGQVHGDLSGIPF
jgi:2-hydroxy-3-oxopropionate reductase